MKKKYLNVLAYAMIVSMSAISLSACSDDDDNDNGGNGGNGGNNGDATEIVMEDGAELQGTVEDGQIVVLSAGNSYTLSGGYAIKNGGELRIEEGVTIEAIYDDQVATFILVEQGGKIDAQGTAEAPIIMTSDVKEPGSWGGIHICGYSHTNRGEGTMSEIGNAPYGGDQEDDNSGTLRYIRLEYTGYAFDEEHESNGVSFYGVGSGTTVEYLQAYKGADDGFEFFGGSVNAKYLVVTDCEDDSFDWTEGWNGKAQFLVATQVGTTGATDADGDCLIEADNQDVNPNATPCSFPTLSNLTLIGNNSSAAARGIRLRAGTHVQIYNAIVTGKPKCLTTATEGTENSLLKGESILNYMTLATDITCEEGIYSSALFTATDNHNEINATIPNFSNVFVGTIADGYDLSAEDDFFTAAAYRGAVEADDDWTAGWTVKK